MIELSEIILLVPVHLSLYNIYIFINNAKKIVFKKYQNGLICFFKFSFRRLILGHFSFWALLFKINETYGIFHNTFYSICFHSSRFQVLLIIYFRINVGGYRYSRIINVYGSSMVFVLPLFTLEFFQFEMLQSLIVGKDIFSLISPGSLS